MEEFEGFDQLTIHLTGGVDNQDPDESLGGVPADAEYRELNFVITDPIPGLQILQVYGENEEGTATLKVNGDGDLVYTPPDGDEGDAVEIAVGETKVVTGWTLGSAEESGVKVYRETSTQDFDGTMTLALGARLNGVLAMDIVEDSERVAGRTTYRCIILTNEGQSAGEDLTDLVLDIDGTGLQSEYYLGTETPDSIGNVQTIADEETAPNGISFGRVTESAESLDIATLDAGESIGIWIKRVYPSAGLVNAREDVQLNIAVEQSGGFDRILLEYYRVAEDALDRYELYVGEDDYPDYEESGQPAATSLTLPFDYALTPPGSGTIVFNLVVAKRNRFDLLSFNQYPTLIEIDDAGDEVLGPLTDPSFEIHASEDLKVVVMASYYENIDRNPATKWKVWGKVGSAPDPDVDTPDYEGNFLDDVAGPQVLRTTIGPYASESNVHVIVAVERVADSEEAEAADQSVLLPATNNLDAEDAGAF